ncbi:MAG TPA: glycosyltransferase, partial [Blastocatellia bacterium]|nr:glycosyltransferase [Blastocatellia bacterium]
MRLSLVISSLSAGGAERVITTLANAWAERNWQVNLVTLDDGSELPFYPLDQRVNHQALSLSQASTNVFSGLRNNLHRIRVLRQVISANQPDVVISFMATTNIRTLIATRGLNVPVIISERINPAFALQSSIWKLGRSLVYQWASMIVAQTEREAESYQSSLQAKVRVIPNPIDPGLRRDQKLVRVSEKKILAVGRLERQKGFDLLLCAFAKLQQKHPEWSLTILGEGRERVALERLIHELGIQDRVSLSGRSREIVEELAQA